MNRWERCVVRRGTELREFVQTYLDASERRLLLIVGGGFDSRSTAFAEVYSALRNAKITAIVVRKERRAKIQKMRDRADQSARQDSALTPRRSVVKSRSFAADNAPIGGREIVRVLAQQSLTAVTDVLLDISALSTGIYFLSHDTRTTARSVRKAQSPPLRGRRAENRSRDSWHRT